MSSVTLCAFIFLSITGPHRPANTFQSSSPGLHEATILRGRIECIDKSGKVIDSPAAGHDTANDAEVNYALVDKDGNRHLISGSDPGAAMFVDPRVRRLDLVLSVRSGEEGRLQVVKVQSTRDGKLYDVYYYCELCNIKAYAPGLCPCCRNEMELRETPP